MWTGDTPVARESCGDAAAYVPIGDLPATTAALERLLFDEETRRRIGDSERMARQLFERFARDVARLRLPARGDERAAS